MQRPSGRSLVRITLRRMYNSSNNYA